MRRKSLRWRMRSSSSSHPQQQSPRTGYNNTNTKTHTTKLADIRTSKPLGIMEIIESTRLPILESCGKGEKRV
jgi:hypothetical protein